MGLELRHISMLIAAWLLSESSFAASPTAVFPVRTYDVTGATLLDPSMIQRTLAPFALPDATFDTLRQAVEALETLYQRQGYGAVRVILPEQNVTAGTVILKVIEARIGKVLIEGNQHFSSDNIRTSLPMLLEGEPPRLEAASNALALANESFAKRTRLTFVKGDIPGLVDAQVRVVDDTPWRIATTLDNTGTETTGRHRLGVSYQHANLFDRDHALSLQWLTSPEKSDKVSILGFGYKIPLYRRGDSIELAYGRSNVDSGNVATAAGNYALSGRGEFTTLRYNLGLPRWVGNEQHLSLAWDRRYYQSRVVPQGAATSLIPDLTSAPLSLGYSIASPEGATLWKAALTHVWNTPSGHNGTAAAYNQAGARPGAVGDYRLWRWNVSTSLPLVGEWAIKVEANGQTSPHMLISGEQFGIGGMDSVRGFNEREVMNDTGHRASLELSSPSQPLPVLNGRLGGVAFVDWGRVERTHPLPAEQQREGIASLGAGLRLGLGKSAQLRADLAQVIQVGGSKRPGDLTLHTQLLVLF